MSERWPGGIVRSTPVTPSGPYQISTAPGIWTLAQASYWAKQGLWPTAGSFPPVELFFSTQVYTGTGSTQTITNGIDLSGQGGLVWAKRRDSSVSHILIDTTRGALNYLETNATSAQSVFANSLTGFTSSGYTMGGATNYNGSGAPFVSWTFRKATNFFDVVTWTGNGVAGRQIAHSLGVAPGMIIVKRVSAAYSWCVWHRGFNSGNGYGFLNTTAAFTSGGGPLWGDGSTYTAPTSTNFTVSTDPGVNANGDTYVAYLFAHDAASTGLIQCGSYTGNGSATGPTVTLGWEPQWVMIKNTSFANDWWMFDNMRGVVTGGNDNYLRANLSSSESTTDALSFNATGFNLTTSSGDYNGSGQNYIYIAIRRGPMQIPTVGTSVFSPVYQTFSGTTVTNTGFVTDLAITKIPATSAGNNFVLDRLRGSDNYTIQQTISTNSTSAEVASSGRVAFTSVSAAGYVSIQNGFLQQSTSANTVVWAFGRAPGFFDEVCVTSGTGTANPSGTGERFNHNLGVVPEMMIWKDRQASTNWFVYHIGLSGNGANGWAYLNTTDAQLTTSDFWSGAQTATECSIRYTSGLSSSSRTLVGYLFASCPGVSKVGSYTGTGAAQTINCGFTTGARFILIKRTDSTGDWYTWDSARGISSGNDPYILLNSSSAQDSSTDYVGTTATGFTLTSSAPAALNANGGTYIFLAIS